MGHGRKHTCALRVIKLIALTTASTGSQPETVSGGVGIGVGVGVDVSVGKGKGIGVGAGFGVDREGGEDGD